VEDTVSELVNDNGNNSNGHVDTDDDAPSDGNTWTRAELDTMPLKELRQLAADLGFVASAPTGIGKKPEIFDWLEKHKKISDEVAESADEDDDEAGDEAGETEEDDPDITLEDLLDKDKYSFKELLAYADENDIKLTNGERLAKKSNRRLIAQRLIDLLQEDDEE